MTAKDFTLDGKTMQEATLEKFTEAARMIDSLEEATVKQLNGSHYKQFEEFRVQRDFLHQCLQTLGDRIKAFAGTIAPEYFPGVKEVKILLEARSIEKIQ